jgi:2-polyprenyl-3-methyl-5-hydroxy-6-metoxy-1,4-benzoquinol methylase
MGTDRLRRGEHFVEEFPDLIIGEKVAHWSVWQRENVAQMKNPLLSSTAHRSACARVAGRFRRGWLRNYVVSKLWTDPAYPAVYELVQDSDEPLVDFGCGLGLLGFYLRERAFQQPIMGLDFDRRKIRYAAEIGNSSYRQLEFRQHDIREESPPFRGNMAILDVLHYLSPADQKTLLVRLKSQVTPGGLLILRDSPRDGTARYWFTYLIEVFTQCITWSVAAPLHFPSLETICENFDGAEFSFENRPLWGGTPFNNQLFIFQRKLSAVAPGAG